MKEMELDDKKYKPAAVHAKISMAKNNLMSAAAYESDAAIFEQNKRAQILRLVRFSWLTCSAASRPMPWISMIC